MNPQDLTCISGLFSLFFIGNIGRGSAVRVEQATYRQAERSGIKTETHRHLNQLFVVTIFTLVFGMITFGEAYSFRNHAISYLGMLRTPGGNSNNISMLIFSFGLVISAAISYRISRTAGRFYIRVLFLLCAMGYLVMITPCDLNNAVHSVGAGMVFGSLWMAAGIWLVRLISHTGWMRFIFYQLILQGSVLPYAWCYLTDHPDKQFLQKIALTGLILILKIACKYGAQLICEAGADMHAAISNDTNSPGNPAGRNVSDTSLN